VPAGTETTITSILFTDLVNSTELTQRLGDEAAQALFESHHRILGELLVTHGGEELQWLGDGLMACFASVADAMRCAVAMQRATLRPISGHRLEIRAGLNVGEVLRQESGSGYFGTPVVIASRLCSEGRGGQILASHTVAGLLAGRQAFRFQDVGSLELKGIATPVGVSEVIYETDGVVPFATQTPFVGRGEEIGRLLTSLEEASKGAGGLVMVVGQPGIGKTRTLEEFAERARARGTQVLWGRCYEGEAARHYAPLAEALEDHARQVDPAELREDLGAFGAAIGSVAPALRERLPDLPQLPGLQPDEERQRLFDAIRQLLLAASQRAPLLVVLDDLHWADQATVALLRYLARFAPRGRLLLVGAYRDVELDHQHPLADALAALRREVEYERILLRGLEQAEVRELLEALAAQQVPKPLVDALAGETEGNPFFLREILIHLVEEGKLVHTEGRWNSSLSVEDLGIPEGVRQVIGRRLSRLSDPANELLRVASGFSGVFRFSIAAASAGLDEERALDALDEALEAQLLRSAGDAECYDFTHALIRHTLYTELNPSRQVRLHRRLAEELERGARDRGVVQPGEIASQYHRSAVLPDAERGVPHCIAAADRAEGAAAHEEAASFLRMALDLLPEGDPREPRVLARLGLALAWSMDVEEAVAVCSRAGERIAASEGDAPAADYLADACDTVWDASFNPLAWRLAEQGLRYVGERRDLTWYRLCGLDLTRREAEDPEAPGIPLDSPERWELREVLRRYPAEVSDLYLLNWSLISVPFRSREDLREVFGADSFAFCWTGGEYRHFRQRFLETAEAALAEGQLATAALNFTVLARIEGALGDLAASERSFARALELAERLPRLPFVALQMSVVPMEHARVRGEGQGAFLPLVEGFLAEGAPENRWVLGTFRALAADMCAELGREAEALRWLDLALPAIERGPGWAINYTALLCIAARTLWRLESRHRIETIEANLREKVVIPDFRYAHRDGRLALAQLAALQGRFDEAHEWFVKARQVLEEEGARPLRAVVDFEEALALARRRAPGDREQALGLLQAALERFEPLGMTGWVRRARELEDELSRG
jgi:class 3 adenylate cyclase/tetratricopeptide (TPR) repeat protein